LLIKNRNKSFVYKVGDKVVWDYDSKDCHRKTVVTNEFLKDYGEGPFVVVKVVGDNPSSQYVFLRITTKRIVPFHCDWLLPAD
jgi:hypothetical protein